jgi:hypothetical protein
MNFLRDCEMTIRTDGFRTEELYEVDVNVKNFS